MYTYQYYRDNPTEYAVYKHKDLIPLDCSACKVRYYKIKRLARHYILYETIKEQYCSKECQNKGQVTAVTEPCANCDIPVIRTLTERKKIINVFCGHSCAAQYNNKHKKHGIRRSKLELFLEQELSNSYPSLNIISNDRVTVGTELDFYFPELRFAIELNGPTHYEPIYGNDKFEKVLAKDKQKMIKCYEMGIELMVIDVSRVAHMNEARKQYFLGIVSTQLDSIMKRIEVP